MLGHPQLRVLGWSAFIYVVAQHTFTFYLVTYLYEHCGLTIAQAGALLSASQIVGTGVRLLSGGAGDRFPRMQLLGWTGIGMTLGCIATGLLEADTPFWLITLVVIGYGSVVISWNGTSQAEFAHLSPPGEAAAVAAVQTSLAFSGAVFGPPIFALIASMLSYRMAFFAVAACVLAAAVWQLLAARTTSAPLAGVTTTILKHERHRVGPMDFFRRFTFLVSAPAFDADDLEGHRLREIIAEIEKLGFQVIRARRIEDAEIAVQTDAAIGCMVVDWGKKGLEGKTAALINLMRRRGLEMPIVMLVRRKRLEDIPVEVLDYIDGYIFLAEETPEFIAKNLVSRLKQYAETLKTPFFGALVDYAERGNQLWTCPGPQRRRVLQPQPDRPDLRRASRRGGLPRRPRQLRARARRPAGPRRPGAEGAAGGGRDLRRREDLFRPERHLVVEQDRALGAGRRGRPRAVRPQQPQGGASRRAVPRRRHSDLSRDRPQRARADRPDLPRGARRRRASARRSAIIRWSPTRRRGGASGRSASP